MSNRLNKRSLILIPFILAASLIIIPSIPRAHAATGLVCIATSGTATSCPASPPTIANLAAGSTLTIGVFIQGSDTMGGFDIYVKTDNTVLNPTAAVFGPLFAHPSSSIRCINDVGVEGACTLGTANAPGVVEMETIESTGVNECFGQASCSGLAFNITYTVQASSGTTPIAYPKAAGCTSSTADPTDCVLVFDSIGNILVETVQAGTYGVVTKDNTSTSVACSPGSIVPTGVSTCTATVTDTTTASNTPTGTFSFTSSNTAVGTVGASCILSSGKCSVAFTGVADGTATVTGVYGGDSTHSGSQGTSGTISVAKDSTSTSVGNVSCNIALGASSCTASVTATVADTTTPSSAPAGTVTFTLTAGTTGGSLSSPTCSLSTTSGVTSCSVTFTGTTAGSGSVIAGYGGDATHNTSSSAAATVTVTASSKDSTSTSVGSVSCNIALGGTSCTASVTATVADTTTPSSAPTGTVTFTLTLGTTGGSLDSNTCSLSTVAGVTSCSVTFTGMTAGSGSVTASYGGDATDNGSTSAPATVTVTVAGKDDTSTSVACSPSSIGPGATSTCMVTVTDTATASNTPTGSVDLISSNTSVGTVDASCTLTSGSCTVTFTGVAAGTATVTATYRGDSTHNGSIGTSGSITVTAVTGQNDFTISASPTSLNVVGESALCEGGSTLCDDEGSTTITLTSINGFDGAIRLARSVSPRNGSLTVYCRPAATQLMPGATVKIRCFVEPEVNPDSQTTFTVKITGRFGALGSTGFLSHSVTITVTVTHAPTPSEDNEGDPRSTLLSASTGIGSTGATTVVGGLIAASGTRADSRGHPHGHGHVCGATAATTATPHNSSPRFLGPSFWDD